MPKNEVVDVSDSQNVQVTDDVLPPDIGERIDEAKRQNKALMNLMDELLKEGVDYGTERGIPKPFLHQPGAQQLMLVFKFRPEFEKIDSVTDLSQNPEFVSYEFKCKLYQRTSDVFMGEGVGSCNNYEKKYRYHKDGAVFKDPLDRQNTLLKMAKKRAMVDAVLNVTGAARLFAQDQDLVYSSNSNTNSNKDVAPNDFEMPFGKHKGKKMKDIPSGYLKWLSSNAKQEHIRNKAQKVLDGEGGGTEESNNKSNKEKKLTGRQKEVKNLIDGDDDIQQTVLEYLDEKKVETVNDLSNPDYKILIEMLENMTDDEFEEPEGFEKEVENAVDEEAEYDTSGIE